MDPSLHSSWPFNLPHHGSFTRLAQAPPPASLHAVQTVPDTVTPAGHSQAEEGSRFDLSQCDTSTEDAYPYFEPLPTGLAPIVPHTHAAPSLGPQSASYFADTQSYLESQSAPVATALGTQHAPALQSTPQRHQASARPLRHQEWLQTGAFLHPANPFSPDHAAPSTPGESSSSSSSPAFSPLALRSSYPSIQKRADGAADPSSSTHPPLALPRPSPSLVGWRQSGGVSDSSYSSSVDDNPLLRQTLHKNGKPRRPLNSFMIFSRARRPAMMQEQPHLRLADIAKELAKEWKEMDPATKKEYSDAAKAVKESFHKQHPEYVYKRRQSGARGGKGAHRKRFSSTTPSSSGSATGQPDRTVSNDERGQTRKVHSGHHRRSFPTRVKTSDSDRSVFSPGYESSTSSAFEHYPQSSPTPAVARLADLSLHQTQPNHPAAGRSADPTPQTTACQASSYPEPFALSATPVKVEAEMEEVLQSHARRRMAVTSFRQSGQPHPCAPAQYYYGWQEGADGDRARGHDGPASISGPAEMHMQPPLSPAGNDGIGSSVVPGLQHDHALQSPSGIAEVTAQPMRSDDQMQRPSGDAMGRTTFTLSGPKFKIRSFRRPDGAQDSPSSAQPPMTAGEAQLPSSTSQQVGHWQLGHPSISGQAHGWEYAAWETRPNSGFPPPRPQSQLTVDGALLPISSDSGTPATWSGRQAGVLPGYVKLEPWTPQLGFVPSPVADSRSLAALEATQADRRQSAYIPASSTAGVVPMYTPGMLRGVRGQNATDQLDDLYQFNARPARSPEGIFSRHQSALVRSASARRSDQPSGANPTATARAPASADATSDSVYNGTGQPRTTPLQFFSPISPGYPATLAFQSPATSSGSFVLGYGQQMVDVHSRVHDISAQTGGPGSLNDGRTAGPLTNAEAPSAHLMDHAQIRNNHPMHR